MSSDFDIQKIAKLARIKVDKKQEAKLKQSIESVLGFVEQIQEANVSNVEPKDFFRLTKNRLRPDQSADEVGVFKKEVMRVAPNSKDDYFKVKKIISK